MVKAAFHCRGNITDADNALEGVGKPEFGEPKQSILVFIISAPTPGHKFRQGTRQEPEEQGFGGKPALAVTFNPVVHAKMVPDLTPKTAIKANI